MWNSNKHCFLLVVQVLVFVFVTVCWVLSSFFNGLKKQNTGTQNIISQKSLDSCEQFKMAIYANCPNVGHGAEGVSVKCWWNRKRAESYTRCEMCKPPKHG